MYENNYNLIWCKEAIAHEIIEEARLTIKWNLLRFYRVGNTKAFSLKIKKDYLKIIKVLLESTFKLITSILILLPSSLFFYLGSKNQFFNLIKRILKSTGFILGVMGNKYEEYK